MNLRPTLWALVLAGLVLAVFGGVRLLDAPRLPQLGVVPPAHPTARAADRAPADPTRPHDDAAVPAVSSVMPVRLRLPVQRVDAGVVAVGVLPGGGLQVPDDPRLLGWWRDGAWPGASRGTVVIDGHVDTRTAGAGALYRLREMPLGAVVRLSTATGEHRYVVRAVHSYSKATLPPEVFDRTGVPRLVLISCGGEFDERTRQYADNIVVYATPVSMP